MKISKNLSMEIEFSEWLQDEIDKRGWSWNKLATEAGLSSGTIYNIRDGIRGVGEDSLKAIASALRMPVETVYRTAGFLPPQTLQVRERQEFEYLFDKLTQEERQEILDWMRFKSEYKYRSHRKQSSRRGTPARSAINEE